MTASEDMTLGISGTRIQQQMNHMRKLKNEDLRRKYRSYMRHAISYNSEFEPNPDIPCPTLKEVEGMEIGHPFLDCGSLTHPLEPWAIDPKTQEGIQAVLTALRCDEELWRVRKEARQMVSWALHYQGKLDALAEEIRDAGMCELICQLEYYMWVLTFMNCMLMAQELPTWAASSEIISVLHHSITQQACQMWMMWNQHIRPLINLSARPDLLREEEETETARLIRWDEMVKRSIKAWEGLVGHNSVAAAEEADVLRDMPEGVEGRQVEEESNLSDGASSSVKV